MRTGEGEINSELNLQRVKSISTAYRIVNNNRAERDRSNIILTGINCDKKQHPFFSNT